MPSLPAFLSERDLVELPDEAEPPQEGSLDSPGPSAKPAFASQAAGPGSAKVGGGPQHCGGCGR